VKEPLKQEHQKLEQAGEALLQHAKKAGADHAEICGSYSTRQKITLEKQDYHLASADEGYSLGVRVLVGKKQGFASCNATEETELRHIATRAVEIARLSPENPNCTIAPSEEIPKTAPKLVWDEELNSLSMQTQKEWTEVMMREAIRDPRFRMNEGSLGVHSSLSLVMNSHGTRKIEKDTMATWSLMGMGVDGDKITSFDYFGKMSRSAKTVKNAVVESTTHFLENVLWGLNQDKGHNYKGVVVFSPRAVLDILLSGLTHHLNGRNLVEGTSKWKLTDVGKKVVESVLTLSDEPWLTDRFGYTTFDREGTPARPMVLIEKGVLKSFMMDHYAATALKSKSTGHAAGGTAAIPSVGAHNLRISADAAHTEPLASLIARTSSKQPDFLFVQRYSGQTDSVTGDFSGVAKGGEWWTNGQRRHCVSETMISGNVFDALGKGLIGISKETEVVDCGEESPTLFIDGVSVTSH
jgi:PmbA protein